jgi:hypothetical protein
MVFCFENFLSLGAVLFCGWGENFSTTLPWKEECMKRSALICSLGFLSLASVYVRADGSYWFDPSMQRYELYNDALVLAFEGIPESVHVSNCRCLKGEYNPNGWPDVNDRGTLRAWYNNLLIAQQLSKKVLVYRSDDWKILSLSNPSLPPDTSSIAPPPNTSPSTLPNTGTSLSAPSAGAP